MPEQSEFNAVIIDRQVIWFLRVRFLLLFWSHHQKNRRRRWPRWVSQSRRKTNIIPFMREQMFSKQTSARRPDHFFYCIQRESEREARKQQNQCDNDGTNNHASSTLFVPCWSRRNRRRRHWQVIKSIAREHHRWLRYAINHVATHVVITADAVNHTFSRLINSQKVYLRQDLVEVIWFQSSDRQHYQSTCLRHQAVR